MLEGITRAGNAVSSVYMLHEAHLGSSSDVERQACWLSRQNKMDKVASQRQDLWVHLTEQDSLSW